MRRTAAGFLEHLVPLEIEKLFILLRPPRESVDPIKSKNMIDPKQMKAVSDGPNTLAPPIEISFAHPRPAIKRDAPILPPFLGELVIFKMRFWRRSAKPV